MSKDLKRHSIGEFRLQSGVVMPNVTIAYRTLGNLSPDGGNAVLVTHGYTSGPQMIEPADKTGPSFEGGWSELIGPGRPIDTTRFFVICPNMLGSSYGSTNAASIDFETGRPYGSRFPDLTVADIVASQKRLLEEMGIRHVVAVVGPSYGGFQAFQWAAFFPDFMDGIVPVVSAPKVTETNTRRLLEQFEKDPGWNGGDYYGFGGIKNTLITLRVATLKRYGVDEWLKETISAEADREAAMREMAATWAEEFDANSLLILSRALEGFDTEPFFDQIKAKVLYVLSRTDQLFSPSLAPGVMDKLKNAKVDADYFEIDSPYGHLASGLDASKWAKRLRMFMNAL